MSRCKGLGLMLPCLLVAAAPLQASSTGAFTTTIPIRVPPGAGGFTPSVSLVYNSQAADGVVGAGWGLALNVPSRITRDLHEGVPSWGYGSRWLLGSSLLIPVSLFQSQADPPPASCPSVYRPSADDLSEVTIDVCRGSAVVRAANGEVRVYEPVRVSDPPRSELPRTDIRELVLQSAQDRSGYRVCYDWAVGEDAFTGSSGGNVGVVTLRRIRWGKGLRTRDCRPWPNPVDATEFARVEFTYTSRSGLTPPYPAKLSFATGAKTLEDQLLVSISVSPPGSPRTEDHYRLYYRASPVTRRPLFEKLTLASGTKEHTLRMFSYTDSFGPQPAFREARSFELPKALNLNESVMREATSVVPRDQGGTTLPGVALPLFRTQYQLADLDGDGMPDLVSFPTDTAVRRRVYWNTGSGFTGPNDALDPEAAHDEIQGRVNAGGWGNPNRFLDWDYAFSGVHYRRFWPVVQPSTKHPYGVNNRFPPVPDFQLALSGLVDLDGDGAADWVVTPSNVRHFDSPSNTYQRYVKDPNWYVLFGFHKGDWWGGVPTILYPKDNFVEGWHRPDTAPLSATHAGVNNKALHSLNLMMGGDLPYDIWTGAAWEPGEDRESVGEVLLIDMNGDRRPDLVSYGGLMNMNGYWNVSLNGGSGFSRDARYQVAHVPPGYTPHFFRTYTYTDTAFPVMGVMEISTLSALIDLNGDGLADWIQVENTQSGTAACAAQLELRRWLVRFNQGPEKGFGDLSQSPTYWSVPKLQPLSHYPSVSHYPFCNPPIFEEVTSSAYSSSPPGWQTFGGATLLLTDFNQDGLPDLLFLDTAAGTVLKVYLSNGGTGFSETPLTVDASFLIRGLPIQLALTLTFRNYSQYMNGIGSDASQWEGLLDINGDGTLDHVEGPFAQPCSGNPSQSCYYYKVYSLSAGASGQDPVKSDLLKRIWDPEHGADRRLTYSPAAQTHWWHGSDRPRLGGDRPPPNLPLLTAEETTPLLGSAPPIKSEYEYRIALWDAHLREFLGFEKVLSRAVTPDSAASAQQETWSREEQDWARRGLPVLSRTRDGNHVLSETMTSHARIMTQSGLDLRSAAYYTPVSDEISVEYDQLGVRDQAGVVAPELRADYGFNNVGIERDRTGNHQPLPTQARECGLAVRQDCYVSGAPTGGAYRLGQRGLAVEDSDNTSDLTIELWFKPATWMINRGASLVFGKDGFYGLWINACDEEGRFNLKWQVNPQGAGPVEILTSDCLVRQGEYHHVAASLHYPRDPATLEPRAGDLELHLFVDGRDHSRLAPDMSYKPDSGALLRIGGSGTYPLDAELGELRLYDGAFGLPPKLSRTSYVYGKDARTGTWSLAEARLYGDYSTADDDQRIAYDYALTAQLATGGKLRHTPCRITTWSGQSLAGAPQTKEVILARAWYFFDGDPLTETTGQCRTNDAAPPGYESDRPVSTGYRTRTVLYNGPVDRHSVAAGDSATFASQRSTYDSDPNGCPGFPVTATDASGATTRTTYDSGCVALLAVENALGHVAKTSYNGVAGAPYRGGYYGQPNLVVDVNGTASVTEYDERGRTVATATPVDERGGPLPFAARTKITHADAVCALSTGAVVACDDAAAARVLQPALIRSEEFGDAGSADAITFANADGLGRVVQVRKRDEVATAKNEKRGEPGWTVSGTVAYDSLGRVTTTYRPAFFPDSSVADPSRLIPDTQPSADGLGLRQQAFVATQYDARSRVIRTIGPDDRASHVHFRPGTTISIDAEGHKRTTERDALGRVRKVTEYHGQADDPGSPNFVPASSIEYQYDRQGRLIQTTDDQNNRTALTFDTLGRRLSMKDPNLGEWKFEYNNRGEMVRQIDAEKNVTAVQYDPLGRPLQKQYAKLLDRTHTFDDSDSEDANHSWPVAFEPARPQFCQPGARGCDNLWRLGNAPTDGPAVPLDKQLRFNHVPPIQAAPWASHSNGSLATGVSLNANAGYQFVPNVDGEITALGGFFNASTEVLLYDASGQVLARATVNSANDWAWAGIPRVSITSGRAYTVSARLAGPVASRRDGIDALPKVYEGITILRSCIGDATTNEPCARGGVTSTGAMFGQVDIRFSARRGETYQTDPPQRVAGSVLLPALDLSGALNATLSFQHNHRTECGGDGHSGADCTRDQMWVEYYDASRNPAWQPLLPNRRLKTWPGSFNLGPYSAGPPVRASLDLRGALAGVKSNLQIRFRFDSVDENDNDYYGWIIDNIQVAATLPSSRGPTLWEYDSASRKSLYWNSGAYPDERLILPDAVEESLLSVSFDQTLFEDRKGIKLSPHGCGRAPFQVIGISGSAARFDGSACLDVANGERDLLGSPAEMTIEAWINPSDTAADRMIFTRRMHYRDVFLAVMDGGRIKFTMFDSDGAAHDLFSATTVRANAWTHVAGIKDAGGMKLYVNGLLNSSLNGDFALASDTGYFGTSIGRDPTDFFGSPFIGLIDEFRIFARARSGIEIQADAQGGAGDVKLDLPFDADIFTDRTGVKLSSLACTRPPSATVGASGNAAFFDGSACLDVFNGGRDLLANASEFTLAAWIRPSDVSANRMIFTRRMHNRDVFLALMAGGRIKFTVFDGNGQAHDLFSGVPVFPNEWAHIAGVKDGTGMRLYVNGLLNNSLAAQFSLGSSSTYYGTSVGRDPSNFFGSPFLGALDEVRLIARARPASEIRADAHEALRCTAARGNVLDLSFDDGNQSPDEAAANAGLSYSATIPVPGLRGTALLFVSRRGASVTVPHSPALALGTAFTLEAWIKPLAYPAASGGYLLWKQAGWEVGLDASGMLQVAVYQGGLRKSVSSAHAIALSRWTHLAAVYTGSEVRLYLDADENGTLSGLNGPVDSAPNVSLVIGKDLDAILDEIKISSFAKSAAEIYADYHLDPSATTRNLGRPMWMRDPDDLLVKVLGPGTAGLNGQASCFDDRGRIVASERALAGTVGSPFIFRQAWDARSRLVSSWYPDREVGRHTYDIGDHTVALTSFSAGGVAVPYLASAAANARGQLVGLEYGNGVRTFFDFADANTGTPNAPRWSDHLLSGIRSYEVSVIPGAGPALQDQQFRYDGVGNLRTRSDAGVQTYAYGYDEQNQLVTFDNGLREPGSQPRQLYAYAYDTLGNLKTKEGGSPLAQEIRYGGSNSSSVCGTVRHAGPHAPVQVTTAAGTDFYCYDRNGALMSVWSSQDLSRPKESYEHGPLGKLITASVNGVVSRFEYDGAGTRIARDENGTLTLEVGENYRIIRSPSAGIGVEKSYFAHGRRLARRLPFDLSRNPPVARGELVFFHPEHLGGVNLMTDNSGRRLVQSDNAGTPYRVEYMPFGNLNLPPKSAEDFSGGFYFGGMELDGTGLYYVNARYYNPKIGRFIEADSLVPGTAPLDFNRYAYVRNNPTRYTDPSGHQAAGVSQSSEGERRDEGRNVWPEIWKDFKETVKSVWEKIERFSSESNNGRSKVQIAEGLPSPSVPDSRSAGAFAGGGTYGTPGNTGQILRTDTGNGSPHLRATRPLSHDDQVVDLIEQYRAASRSDYEAWDRAREDYRPIRLRGGNPVLRDAEHFLLRYWLASKVGEYQTIPRNRTGATDNPTDPWWDKLPMNSFFMQNVHDVIYNPLREHVLEHIMNISPTTPSMYEWEKRGYEYGYCAAGRCDMIWRPSQPNFGSVLYLDLTLGGISSYGLPRR